MTDRSETLLVYQGKILRLNLRRRRAFAIAKDGAQGVTGSSLEVTYVDQETRFGGELASA